jgi:hypothetical protein
MTVVPIFPRRLLDEIRSTVQNWTTVRKRRAPLMALKAVFGLAISIGRMTVCKLRAFATIKISYRTDDPTALESTLTTITGSGPAPGVGGRETGRAPACESEARYANTIPQRIPRLRTRVLALGRRDQIGDPSPVIARNGEDLDPGGFADGT